MAAVMGRVPPPPRSQNRPSTILSAMDTACGPVPWSADQLVAISPAGTSLLLGCVRVGMLARMDWDECARLAGVLDTCLLEINPQPQDILSPTIKTMVIPAV